MTRRIALTVLALVTVLLVLAVVPLGVLLTQREETSFRSTAEASAGTLASAAEEHLSDHKPDTDMRELLDETQDEGGCAAVFDAAGQVVARTSCSTATDDGTRSLVAAALAHPHTTAHRSGDTLTVATPIGDSADKVGVAVLVKSADPLDDRIAVVWGWLALIGVVGLVLGTVVSVRLARWVGRPSSPSTPQPGAWARARWTSGPRPTPGRRRYAGSRPPSTPWPHGPRPWCTATGR
ncbi:hypothetical protein GCM10025734_16290 [Kitasatospora paranensis]|uniref:hypothetical protein n=1 Tax=Kitasatospora paranensis TaxID=258053 RepID=UPI0031E642F3